MTHSSVTIQITPNSQPSTPTFLGEVAAVAPVLTLARILKAIQQRVQFARAHFGHDDLINFAVVLIGYALSGEPTLNTSYVRLVPFADSFMVVTIIYFYQLRRDQGDAVCLADDPLRRQFQPHLMTISLRRNAAQKSGAILPSTLESQQKYPLPRESAEKFSESSLKGVCSLCALCFVLLEGGEHGSC